MLLNGVDWRILNRLLISCVDGFFERLLVQQHWYGDELISRLVHELRLEVWPIVELNKAIG
jgi:hypothetical protein